jgi:hypothetical protein
MLRKYLSGFPLPITINQQSSEPKSVVASPAKRLGSSLDLGGGVPRVRGGKLAAFGATPDNWVILTLFLSGNRRTSV